jgi:hypothetical protein
LRCIKNENDDENENNESVIPSEERDLASRLGKRLCRTLHLALCAGYISPTSSATSGVRLLVDKKK